MLSDEQLKEREWATRNIISSRPDGGKPYLFISYKSDDWNVVLNEIVRNME